MQFPGNLPKKNVSMDLISQSTYSDQFVHVIEISPPSGSKKGRRGSFKSCHQCRQSIRSDKGKLEIKKGKERLKCGNCCKLW